MSPPGRSPFWPWRSSCGTSIAGGRYCCWPPASSGPGSRSWVTRSINAPSSTRTSPLASWPSCWWGNSSAAPHSSSPHFPCSHSSTKKPYRIQQTASAIRPSSPPACRKKAMDLSRHSGLRPLKRISRTATAKSRLNSSWSLSSAVNVIRTSTSNGKAPCTTSPPSTTSTTGSRSSTCRKSVACNPRSGAPAVTTMP